MRPAGCIVFVVVLLSLTDAAGKQVPAPTSTYLFSALTGDSLSGWTVEHKSPDSVTAANGVMTVTDQAGWVRVERIVGDFTLRLDARMTSPSGGALLVIRGHNSSREALGYALPLATDTASIGSAPKLTMLRFNQSGLAHALRAQDDWHTYVVHCEGGHIIASVNGEVIASESGLSSAEGWIGVRTEGAILELRKISIGPPKTQVQPSQGFMANPAYLPGNTVTLPKLLREVKPAYTADAMRAKISGAVLLECVIRPDGRVSDVQVLRSLDPNFGLDQEAIKAASQWRFAPGLKDGQPVPVVVTIELTFTLRK